MKEFLCSNPQSDRCENKCTNPLLLNVSESQGDFQAALKMEPNLFTIELRSGHVGPCWSLPLCDWQILLLSGSSQLIPTTTCKIAPFCKVWHWCFKIMSVLLEVTELVIQGLGAFHYVPYCSFKSSQVCVSWNSSECSLLSGIQVYHDAVGLSLGDT